MTDHSPNREIADRIEAMLRTRDAGQLVASRLDRLHACSLPHPAIELRPPIGDLGLRRMARNAVQGTGEGVATLIGRDRAGRAFGV